MHCSSTLTLLLLLHGQSCAAAWRRILHEPFFPDSSAPPPVPPSPTPTPTPAMPFTNPDVNSPFFPNYPPSPPPPSPSAFATFPANISSLIVPRSLKPNHSSQKLLVVSLVASVAAIILLICVAYYYHRRCDCRDSSSTKVKPRRSKASNSSSGNNGSRVHSSIFAPMRNGHGRKVRGNPASSEFLYLGTIADSHQVDPGMVHSSSESNSSRILDSPELFPLPPLHSNPSYHHGELADEDEEDFYSPKGSMTDTATRVFTVNGDAVQRAPVTRSSAAWPLSTESSVPNMPYILSDSMSSPPARFRAMLPPSPTSTVASHMFEEVSVPVSPVRKIDDDLLTSASERCFSTKKIVIPSTGKIGSVRTSSFSDSSCSPISERLSNGSHHVVLPSAEDIKKIEISVSSDASLSSSTKKCSIASIKSLPGSPPLVAGDGVRTVSSGSSPDRRSNKSEDVPVAPPAPPPRPPPPPPPPPPLTLHFATSAKTPVDFDTFTPKNDAIGSKPPALVPPAMPFSLLSNTTNISPVELPQTSSSEKGDSSEEAVKPKLKPLHWDKVRASSDREMVWDHLKSSSFKVNEEMIETLFMNNSKPKQTVLVTPQLVIPAANQENRVLDPKRAQNISILLRALNVTTDEVCDALLEGNADALGAELLESLLKMAPTKEEERRLRDFNDDSPLKLGQAEKFLKAIIDIPHAFKRAEAMLYIANFETEIEYLKKSFHTLEVACEELRNSRMFLKLLEAVLKTGNRMNVGTKRGDALAFKLDTLLKLVDVKGADGKTTLLHFVVQEIIRTEGNPTVPDDAKCRKMCLHVVSGLSSELANVKKAAGMDSEVLSGDVVKLSRGIQDISEVLKLIDGHAFSESMNRFLKHAEEEIIRIQAQESVALSLVKEITEYFHGNSAKEEAHPFRIFMVVRDFLCILDRVCKEVGMINERTVVSSAHKFPVPVNPMLANMKMARNDSTSDEEDGGAC